MRRRDQVVSKTEIMANVWDASTTVTPMVEVYVGYLRRKIDARFGRRCLETVRGAGYRLRDEGCPTRPFVTDGTGGCRATLSCWRRRSLRARLTAAATIVIAVGMAAAAVLLVWRVHSVLTADLDANLIRQGGTNIQRGQLKPRTLTLRTSHFPDLPAATQPAACRAFDTERRRLGSASSARCRAGY